MEVGGRVLGQLDQAAFVEGVVVIERAVDLLVEEGLLIDEARLEHQVLAHFSSGPEAIEHFDASTKSEITADLRVRVARIDRPVVQRADCLLRRLRVVQG